MIYKEFRDLKLSALGMGTMRLPLIDGNDAEIDRKTTEKMIAYAMEQGINYYDTAWGYHAGNSERVIGEALKKYPRESFYLATKFPGYDLKNMDKAEEIFEKQLAKCQVDYFDFYLFHNVCEMNIDAYLDPKYGIKEYLVKQREAGRIRHLGFSVHGTLETMKRFLAEYGDCIEFAQVQLNFFDWEFQDAKSKVKVLNERNIPVWVMEPLRGGKLLNLRDEYRAKLEKARPGENAAAWAFRFLQATEGVTMILSGMSTPEQLEENIRIFNENKPLSADEKDLLLGIAEEMRTRRTLPCTACHYCTSHCSQGLDIPWLISLYNEQSYTEGGFIAPMALSSLPKEKRPGACIGCRSCEAVCPQNIKISEVMADFAARS